MNIVLYNNRHTKEIMLSPRHCLKCFLILFMDFTDSGLFTFNKKHDLHWNIETSYIQNYFLIELKNF